MSIKQGLDISAFTEQLGLLLQTRGAEDWMPAMCGLLQSHTGAGAVLYGADERVLAHSPPSGRGKWETGHSFFTPPGGVENECINRLALPVRENNVPIGSLVLYREDGPLSAEEKLAANIVLSVCAVLFRQHKTEAETERRRRADAVKAVINTLSFSELEAAAQVFYTLRGIEGLLVAGRIADGLGITRSVVVNALRKLEGAGMIETRSLGMKGTHIRVLNPLLADELSKFKR